jgi:molybdenum cofactor biosynthesis enzyme MoaA
MALLDVVIDYDCNLKCTYCTITDEMRRRGLDAKVVAGHIEEAARRGVRNLSITGGEPTIRRELIPLVNFARSRGFTDIKVQSNGLMFSDRGYVDRLCDAGANRFHVSVHGHTGSDATPYAAVTQGGSESHALMLEGITNLVAAGMRPAADMIVMASTHEGLLDGVKDLHHRGVTSFTLWLVSLTDQNKPNLDSLPRITDMIPSIMRCLDYAQEQDLDMQSLHVPRCLLPGYEDQVYHPGFQEDVHVVTPDAVFQLSSSRLSGQTKTDRCSGCKWIDLCPGLRDDYLERWGDEELTAVT